MDLTKEMEERSKRIKQGAQQPSDDQSKKNSNERNEVKTDRMGIDNNGFLSENNSRSNPQSRSSVLSPTQQQQQQQRQRLENSSNNNNNNNTSSNSTEEQINQITINVSNRAQEISQLKQQLSQLEEQIRHIKDNLNEKENQQKQDDHLLQRLLDTGTPRSHRRSSSSSLQQQQQQQANSQFNLDEEIARQLNNHNMRHSSSDNSDFNISSPYDDHSIQIAREARRRAIQNQLRLNSSPFINIRHINNDDSEDDDDNHNNNNNNDISNFIRIGPFGTFQFSSNNSRFPFDNNNEISRFAFNSIPENLSYEQLSALFPNLPRGANEESIEQLPVDTFKVAQDEQKSFNNEEKENKTTDLKSEKDNLNKENHSCSICLEAFKNGDQIRRLPCLHIFHKNEIDKWLHTNHVCPICRTPIDEQPQLPQ